MSLYLPLDLATPECPYGVWQRSPLPSPALQPSLVTYAHAQEVWHKQAKSKQSLQELWARSQVTWWEGEPGDILELIWSYLNVPECLFVLLCFLVWQEQWDNLTISTGYFRKQSKHIWQVKISLSSMNWKTWSSWFIPWEKFTEHLLCVRHCPWAWETLVHDTFPSLFFSNPKCHAYFYCRDKAWTSSL